MLEEQGFEVCADEGDAAGALSAALRERPDLCLLDIHMPGSGIEATSAIRFQLPETKIVMLTASREDGDLFDAVNAGASGYLLKDVDPDRLARELNASTVRRRCRAVSCAG